MNNIGAAVLDGDFQTGAQPGQDRRDATHCLVGRIIDFAEVGQYHVFEFFVADRVQQRFGV